MTIGYDSPEVQSEHESELAVTEETKRALNHFVETLKDPNFQLKHTGEGIYSKPDENHSDNIQLARDLDTILTYVSGKHLRKERFPFIEVENGLRPQSGIDYSMDALKDISYRISYARSLREDDHHAPGEGDISTEYDLLIPGAKQGDVQLRININNDKDGNHISFEILRPDTSDWVNQELISEKPVDITPYKERLAMIQ